jgi:hypothetical protein
VVDSLGIIRTFAGVNTNGYSGNGGLATAAELSSPKGVAADGWDRVYIADYDNNVVRLITPYPIISEVGEVGGKQLAIYPNPTRGMLTIELPQLGDASLQITDVLGRVIMEKKLSGGQQSVTLTDLPAGNCIVRVQVGANVYRSKVTVTK